MSYVLLCPDMEISPDITMTDNGSCFDLIWETGHLIDQTEQNLSVLEFICETLPTGYFPDYAVSDFGCPIVSKRLKNLLDKSGVDNIEYFPASIIEKAGKTPNSDYYALNIIGLVDCIDTENSLYRGDVDDGVVTGISRIRKLKLKMPERNFGSIFRPHLFRRIIIIDSKFQELFKHVGIEGARFIKPERWDGFNGEKQN